jgi:hypothetical protein
MSFAFPRKTHFSLQKRAWPILGHFLGFHACVIDEPVECFFGKLVASQKLFLVNTSGHFK